MQSQDLMALLLYLASQPVSKGGGGGGDTSVYLTSCDINDEGHLIVTLSDSTVIDAGVCKGDTGAKGDKGDKGDTGDKGDKGDKGDTGDNGISPTISVVTNTTSVYQLKITNADGTSFITPNLIGTGSTSTRSYVFENALYNNYTDKTYTIFNSALKSLQEYIDEGASFCKDTTNHTLNYSVYDFGWNGSVVSFSTTPVTISHAQYLLMGYISNSAKSGEFIKFIPSNMITGSTDAEKAQSIQTALASESSSILSLDFSYEYAVNGVTEAVSLANVTDGDYYIAWSATSDNSSPKISDITIM